MTINIVGSFKKAHQAKGLVVVIDVLRAFTTTCFVFANKADKIIVVAEIKEARQIKKNTLVLFLWGKDAAKNCLALSIATLLAK